MDDHPNPTQPSTLLEELHQESAQGLRTRIQQHWESRGQLHPPAVLAQLLNDTEHTENADWLS